MSRKLITGLLAIQAIYAAWPAGAAQPYPSKPIRVIVGFTPGGNDDYVGRVFANRVQERFGQTVIVDNRPGTGGNIGVELMARANPDGYTLSSVGSITVASGPSLYTKIGYDPLKDFAYVSRMAIGANVLFVHPAVPARTVPELVALAQAQPKELRYGTPGVASLGHLAVELLQNEEIRAKFPPLGLDPAASTPEEFTEIVKSELAKWTRVIKDANIKAN